MCALTSQCFATVMSKCRLLPRCHPSPYQLWIAQLHAVLQQQRWNLPDPPLVEGGRRSVKSRHRAQAIT